MDLMPVGSAERHEVARLLQLAAEGLRGRRGGDALLTTWIGAESPSAALKALEASIAPSTLHVALPDDAVGLSVAWVGPEAGCFAVWVDPGSRHLGWGPKLAQAAIEWLESEGAPHIDALALPGDREMKNVLERAGFKARLLTLRRSG